MSMRLATAVLTLGLAQVACGWKLETQPAPTPSADASAGAGAEEAASERAKAPPFSLANDDGSFVSLDELLAEGKPAILVFYRGHW